MERVLKVILVFCLMGGATAAKAQSEGALTPSLSRQTGEGGSRPGEGGEHGPGGSSQESTNAPASQEPAKLKVSGYGFFGNLRLKRMLSILREGKTNPPFFDANYVEDAALLIMSRLRDDGHLRPVLIADVTFEDGTHEAYVWEKSVEEPLPRGLRARRLHFRIDEGVLYHIAHLEFDGLTVIPEKSARGYFVETGGLISLKNNRIYSPDALKRSVENLTAELRRLGYQDAQVNATNLNVNPAKGRVEIAVRVQEGPRYLVESVIESITFGSTNTPGEVRTNDLTVPYSRFWEQDYAQSIRTNYYQQGYPDTEVDLEILTRAPVSNQVFLTMRADVNTGPRIRVGDVSLTGNVVTKDYVLERRLPLDEGDWLDRVKAERGRYRLSRLGIFESVQLRYEPVDAYTRSVTYELDEGKRYDVSLLFGYGSYELVRGGIIFDQYNVFGRAHHQRAKLIQSFKSSSGEYTYTMPEFFGENMDVFINANGLRREEISFTRVEYGGGAGVRKYFRGIDTDVTARYKYQVLKATDVDPDLEFEGLSDSRAAAIIFNVNRDRRDNPLYPHRGHRFYTEVEVASDYLGGDVDYQRVEFAYSHHFPVASSRWIHFGVSHGMVATAGNAAEDLPFNKRFFPGGENSVRGYQQGEAAPRNDEGDVVGAETYTSASLEFEQGITPKWSVVAFADGVVFARRLQDYPADEGLLSVGAGIRWKTFIGPVRLEYGHNLNPRNDDPSGTLHFALGFPF